MHTHRGSDPVRPVIKTCTGMNEAIWGGGRQSGEGEAIWGGGRQSGEGGGNLGRPAIWGGSGEGGGNLGRGRQSGELRIITRAGFGAPIATAPA